MRKPLYLLALACLLCTAHHPMPSTRPGGKDYALFFAVEQYDNSSAWKPLPGLIRECEDIRNDLVERYGFSTESKVVKNPSLADIQAELARWRRRGYGPDDQLMVFFSGHGQFLDDVQEGFFVPKDGKPSTGEMSERKWYSLLQLPRHVTTIPCQHILLAIDACYSGTIDSRVALKDEHEEWAAPRNQADALLNQYVHDLLSNKSRILMTSGGKNRTKHPSDFVRWFREALATLGGKDRILRSADIPEFWPLGAERPLAGNFEGHAPGGNFLFVYQPKTNAAPKPSASPDYDDDGIPDKDDKCPTEKGTAAAKGCPDADGDGVADKFDNCPTKPGSASNNGCPEFKAVKKQTGNSVFVDPMATTMVEVIGGTFKMGNTDGFAYEKPLHDVTISTFWLSKYEVTIGQYLAFCEATHSHWPAWLEKGNSNNIETGAKKDYYKSQGMSRTNINYPVTGVYWEDAIAFCTWLNEKTGLNYRFPTEAEWEYAARGGSRSKGYKYSGSDACDQVAWSIDNSGGKVHAVGGLQANELGLYDMSGNLYEWCADWYDPDYYKNSPKTNPVGPTARNGRVLRGGSWVNEVKYCHVASRSVCAPFGHSNYIGFRLARTP